MEIPNQRIKDSGIVSNEILKGIHINQMPFQNINRISTVFLSRILNGTNMNNILFPT